MIRTSFVTGAAVLWRAVDAVDTEPGEASPADRGKRGVEGCLVTSRQDRERRSQTPRITASVKQQISAPTPGELADDRGVGAGVGEVGAEGVAQDVG